MREDKPNPPILLRTKFLPNIQHRCANAQTVHQFKAYKYHFLALGQEPAGLEEPVEESIVRCFKQAQRLSPAQAGRITTANFLD